MAVTAWGGGKKKNKTLAATQTGNKCGTIPCQTNVVGLD